MDANSSLVVTLMPFGQGVTSSCACTFKPFWVVVAAISLTMTSWLTPSTPSGRVVHANQQILMGINAEICAGMVAMDQWEEFVPISGGFFYNQKLSNHKNMN